MTFFTYHKYLLLQFLIVRQQMVTFQINKIWNTILDEIGYVIVSLSSQQN